MKKGVKVLRNCHSLYLIKHIAEKADKVDILCDFVSFFTVCKIFHFSVLGPTNSSFTPSISRDKGQYLPEEKCIIDRDDELVKKRVNEHSFYLF